MKRGDEQTKREAKDLWRKLKDGEAIEEDDLGEMENISSEDEETVKKRKEQRELAKKKKKIVVKKNDKRVTAEDLFKENNTDQDSENEEKLQITQKTANQNNQESEEIDQEGLEIDPKAGRGEMQIGVMKSAAQDSLVAGLDLSKLRASAPKSQKPKIQKRNYIEFDSDSSENEEDKEEIDARDTAANEKYLAQQKEKDEKVTNNLQTSGFNSGWGNWAGGDEAEEIENEREKRKLERERKKKLRKAMRERRDAKMKNVKISTKRIKDTQGLFLQDIPFEFENKEQVNFIMNQPIGSEWNSQQNYLRNIRSKVKTKAGAVIRPIGKSDGSYKVSHF